MTVLAGYVRERVRWKYFSLVPYMISALKMASFGCGSNGSTSKRQELLEMIVHALASYQSPLIRFQTSDMSLIFT